MSLKTYVRSKLKEEKIMYIITITTSNVPYDKILYNLFNICFLTLGCFTFKPCECET